MPFNFDAQTKRAVIAIFAWLCVIAILISIASPTLALDPSSGPRLIESDDPLIQQQGSWTTQASLASSGGRYLVSSGSPDDILTHTFTGASLEILYVEAPQLGILAIEVDGVVLRSVITQADATNYQRHAVIDYLSDEPHTLRVYASQGVIGVDAFMTTPTDTQGDISIADSSPAPRLGLCNADDLTHRVSIASDGTQGNSASGMYDFDITPDGRYITFSSFASNLVAGDTNGAMDIFVHDRTTCQTTRVSIATDGTESNSYSGWPVISADGRYVAFWSVARNLIPGGPAAFDNLYLRDRVTNTTTLIGPAAGFPPAISDDGHYLAFDSGANSLVSGDTNGQVDIFVYDITMGTISRVSVATDGTESNDATIGPSISSDGRYVAFESDASNLVSGDTNGVRDIFVHDAITGTTTRVSVATGGGQASGSSYFASISRDGRYIAFESDASDLVSEDTNTVRDVFVHDMVTGTTTCVSVATGGTQSNGSSSEASVSGNGRYITFSSFATNLVSGDTNATQDVFVYDQTAGTTTHLSIATDGAQPNAASGLSEISGNGRYVAFISTATNLVANDTNVALDIFVRIAVPSMPVLQAPSGLIATAVSVTQINLSWTDNSSDETALTVERSLDGVTGWTLLGTMIPNTTTYGDMVGLTCGTTYYYRVRGYRSTDDSYSAYSNVANATTNLCALNAPSNLSATPISTTQIGLQWVDNSSDETEFRVERSSDGVSGWIESTPLPANQTTFTNSGLICGTTYYYRVRGYRSSDTSYSAYSNVASASTNLCALNAPSNLSAAPISMTQISLGWIDNSTDETEFRVERSSDGVSGWVESTPIPANQRTFTNSGLICGTTYYYRVRGYRSSDVSYSAYSNVVPTTTLPCYPTGTDQIMLVRPSDNTVYVRNTFTNPPPANTYATFSAHPPAPALNGQWVMGDWNGDGHDSPGIYATNGVFYYTNTIGTNAVWYELWIGFLGRPPVAGRFNAAVNHDCIGVVDSAQFPPYGTAFALYFACDMTNGNAPTLTFQWLSVLLPDSQGHTGAFQFTAGDFDGNGLDSIAVRRSAYIAWTNVPPTTLLSEFSYAQYIGAPSNTDYGLVVAGDWDQDGLDSFGLYYQNGVFYRRNDLMWNSGVGLTLALGTPLGTPTIAMSWH